MIPRDRVVAALRLEPVDRVPAVSLMTGVTTELMQLCGVHYPEAHHSAGPMVTLAAAAHEFCGLESIKLPFDMTVETELLGGNVHFGDERTLPTILAAMDAFHSSWKPLSCQKTDTSLQLRLRPSSAPSSALSRWPACCSAWRLY